MVRLPRVIGQNAEAKTAQNNGGYAFLNLATQESWKNDKGDYENRTECTASMLGVISRSSPELSRRDSSSHSKVVWYREVEDEVQGTRFKHRIAEIHAISMNPLSKIETADDPADGAGDR